MEKYSLLTKNGARWVATKWSDTSLVGLGLEFCPQSDKVRRCFCCGELITDSYYCTIYFKVN